MGSKDEKSPIDLNSNGEEIKGKLVNEYGKLLGEYSKLDHQIWLTKSENNEEEAMTFCSEGHDWTILPSNPAAAIADIPMAESADNLLLLADGGKTFGESKSNISSPNDFFRSQSHTFSPISVLRRRSFSSESFAMKRARSKHRRGTKLGSRIRFSGSENCKQSFALDDTTDSLHDGLVRTRKIADLLQLHFVETNSNSNSNSDPTAYENQQMEVVKKCVRCDSAKTPQWRDGPTGRKTLCNACGLQYKKAFPSDIYHPSSTLKPQTQQVKKCVQCETVMTPQWRDGPEGSKTLCNACGIQYKKGRPMRTPGYDSRRYKKKVPKMIMVENSGGIPGSDSDSALLSDVHRPLKNLNPQVQVVKKCVHCQTTTTPQWRNGPEGLKTLCNACGMQYKKGRPMRTPGFDSRKYKRKVPKMIMIENSEAEIKAKTPHDKVEETDGILGSGADSAAPFNVCRPMKVSKPRTQVVKKCMHCETETTPQWRKGPEGSKTLCNACGMQYKKGRPMRSPGFDSRQYKKKVPKIITAENSEVDHSCARKAKAVHDIMITETGDKLGLESDSVILSDSYRPLNTSQPHTHVVVKKCVHCETTSTPQWRDGPEGSKTLCNACGIQYKKGRPMRTPGFDSHQYRKKVPEMIIIENSEVDQSGARKTDPAHDLIGETSGIRGSDSDSAVLCDVWPISMLKPQMLVVKKCMHCETETTPQWRKGPEGSKTLCNACGMQYKKGRPMRTPGSDSHQYKRKVQDMLDLESDSDFQPWKFLHRKKLAEVEVKKCSHCETTDTPQWREGPLGRKTLCNACGVQYRHGRLFPEYRPLQSPNYDPSLHSHLPKKVEQMRKRKFGGECATSEDTCLQEVLAVKEESDPLLPDH